MMNLIINTAILNIKFNDKKIHKRRKGAHSFDIIMIEKILAYLKSLAVSIISYNVKNKTCKVLRH